MDQEPTWELIVNGVAIVLNVDARRRCHELVKEVFPDSFVPIELARHACEVGSHGGLSMPFILKKEEQLFQLCYLWHDAVFHDKAVVESMSRHPDSARVGHHWRNGTSMKLPDFRPWGCTFRLDTVTAESTTQVFSVHKNL